MEVMAQMGSEVEQESSLHHNERLEFLGDAVVELVVSYHLFFMLPHVAEGVLAAKRSQLVKNAHLGSVGQVRITIVTRVLCLENGYAQISTENTWSRQL